MSCSQKYYYVRTMIYRYCEKDTRNRSKMILANGNGKTLVHNTRNKANKAAKRNLLGVYIFSFSLLFLIKSYCNYGYGSNGCKLIKFKFYSSRKKNLTPSSLEKMVSVGSVLIKYNCIKLIYQHGYEEMQYPVIMGGRYTKNRFHKEYSSTKIML